MSATVPPPPVISIVTPSYNQGEFLAQTIESVLSQAGDFCIDYLIMDGGSTDQSVRIIRRYEALLESGQWPVACASIRYRWVSEPDHGQSDALGKGFRLAQGELLAWLNSDDFYLPGALQAAASFFRAHPDTGLMYGAADYCDTDGQLVGSYRTEEFDYLRLAACNFVCQPSTFFSRAAFEAVGGLDPALHFAMDYDLWIRLGRQFPCRYLPRVLSSYRLHQESKTIRDDTLAANMAEGLQVVLKHYGWAPLTRVYPLCNLRLKGWLPPVLSRSRLLVIGASLVCTLLRSLILNRGLRRDDLALLNRSNLRKLFKSRSEVMLGSDARESRGGR